MLFCNPPYNKGLFLRHREAFRLNLALKLISQYMLAVILGTCNFKALVKPLTKQEAKQPDRFQFVMEQKS